MAALSDNAFTQTLDQRLLKNIDATLAGTGASAPIVQGTAADGAAATGNPVLVAGKDVAGGTNAKTVAVSAAGRVVIAVGGSPVADGNANTVAPMRNESDTQVLLGVVPVLYNGTTNDLMRDAKALDAGATAGVAATHDVFINDAAGTLTSVNRKGMYNGRTTSATNTAQAITIDTKGLSQTLSIHMAASASTATLVVEASADNTNWIQADSIAAAAAIVKVYGASTAGAAAAAAAAGPIAPLSYRYIRITAGTAGVGNTTTLTIGIK